VNRAQEQQIAEAANRAAVLFEHEGWKWVDPNNREYPVTAAHLALMIAHNVGALSADDEWGSTGRLVFLKEDWSRSIRILVEVGSIDVKQATDGMPSSNKGE
jgi:hypothetical protein